MRIGSKLLLIKEQFSYLLQVLQHQIQSGQRLLAPDLLVHRLGLHLHLHNHLMTRTDTDQYVIIHIADNIIVCHHVILKLYF